MQLVRFTKERYNFDKIVAFIFGVDDLSYLHKLYNKLPEVVEFKNDQLTELHKKFYSNKEIFLPSYELFIKEVIRPLFCEPILYQKVPTFRVQLPENLAVGEFHKDCDYGHSINEVNFFVPLTWAIHTSTIWIENKESERTSFPPMCYGDMMQWDGANIKHGNKVNEQNRTRVSIDFRVLPLSLYNQKDGENCKTVHMGKRMIIGDYFDSCN